MVVVFVVTPIGRKFGMDMTWLGKGMGEEMQAEIENNAAGCDYCGGPMGHPIHRTQIPCKINQFNVFYICSKCHNKLE